MASVMARAGCDVLVLEASREFVDRVRGELIAPWGLEEVGELALTDALFSVPHVNIISRYAPYDETISVENAIASTRNIGDAISGIAGMVGVSHPGLSEALLLDARHAGASIRRGIADVGIVADGRARLTFTAEGERHEVSCRLLVGADGRQSVVRRQLGWELCSTKPRVYMGGMLVGNTEGWPRDLACSGVEGDIHFLVFPQSDGLTRLYLAWSADHPHRFAGKDRERRFLDAFQCECIPQADALVNGTPAGPCASFPMTDSWLNRPAFSEDVVLIGDAAGWSDPIAGQGLSVAFRDVRVLSELLLSGAPWTTELLGEYDSERSERMRRIRFAVDVLGLTHGFGEEAQHRRRAIPEAIRNNPTLGAGIICRLLGVWRAPEDGFTPEAFAALQSAGQPVA